MAINLSEKLKHLVKDRQAFEKVLKQIYQIAFDMVHNHQDAEDLVQQSLLKGLQSACVVDEHYQLTIG